MDNKELEKIYNDTYRSVYWTAMSLLKNEDEAQDIVQETFVTLIDSYDTLKDKDKVAPWLKKIAANKSLDRLRRTKTINAEDDFFEDVEAQPEDFLPESMIESDEKRRIIMDIIENALSDDIRRTLILFYYDEMTTKEIASLLGIPQGTVLWRLNYAKKKIKKEVEKYEEENDDRLYAMAVPFLTKLFEKEAEQVPLKPMAPSLEKLTASDTPSKAAPDHAALSTAAKTGAGLFANKIIIGAIASVLAVVIALVVIINVMNKPEKTSKDKDLSKKAKVEETTTEKVIEETTKEVSTEETMVSDTSIAETSEAEDLTLTAAEIPGADLIGKWTYSESGYDYFMEFGEDGSLDIWQANSVGEEIRRESYTYTVEGNELTIMVSSDNPGRTIYTIEGDTLTISNPDNPSEASVFTRAESTSNTPEYTASDLSGTWVLDGGNSSIYMSFTEDGSVECWVIATTGEEFDRVTNVYTITGNELYMTYANGQDPETFIITIDGDTLRMATPDHPETVLEFTKQ